MRLAPRAEVRLFPLNGLILSGGLNGGVTRSSLQEMLDLNPYLSTSTVVQHEDIALGYDATIRIEPTNMFGVRLSGARNLYDKYLYFDAPTEGRFAPSYAEATVDKIIGDAYLNIGSDELKAAVTFMEGTVGAEDKPLPYVPKWDAEIGYTHSMIVLPLSITGTLRYISERPAASGVMFDEAYLLGLEGKFSLSSLFDVTLQIDNLFDQRYEIWDGYRERGVFIAVGAKTRL